MKRKNQLLVKREDIKGPENRKESHAYTTSEENTIWNLLGQDEGPLFSALHILILKTLEALILIELPQQSTGVGGDFVVAIVLLRY